MITTINDPSEISKAHQDGAEFILLLGRDTTIAPDCIDNLLAAAKTHPEAGAFGPKIFDYDDPATLWFAGAEITFPALECKHTGLNAADYDAKLNTITPTGHIPSCALLIRSSTLSTVGLFDPRLNLWGDIDWCHRLRKADYTCLFVPTAKAWHKLSTKHDSAYHFNYHRERLLFAKKNLSLPRKIRFFFLTYPKELLFSAIASLIAKKKEQRSYCRATLKGMLLFSSI